MRKSCPEEPGENSEEFEEMRRRALEPFRPRITMEDVLQHEERIRQASIEYLKEEGRRARRCKKDTEIEKASYIPPLDFDVKFDY